MSRMVRLPVFALATALALPLQAHRLDEVLQGTLISILPEHVIIEVNISPGVETVQRFLALADTDGDGMLSPDEQETYARRVMEDILLEIDHQPTRLDLRQSTFPPVEEMRAGTGTIRFALHAQSKPVATGLHQVYLRNNHAPGISVYQVNALVPRAGLEILAQQRDPLQREITIRYRSNAGSPVYPSRWPLVTGLVVVALAAGFAERRLRPLRTRSAEPRSSPPRSGRERLSEVPCKAPSAPSSSRR